MKIKSVYAWTWLLDEGELCFYSYPTKKMLLNGHTMGGAKPVRVKMVYSPIRRPKSRKPAKRTGNKQSIKRPLNKGYYNY